MKQRTDADGRVWEYNDCEGTYSRKVAGKWVTIGCAARNGRRWMNWSDRDASWEYDTLAEAMESLGYLQDRRAERARTACDTTPPETRKSETMALTQATEAVEEPTLDWRGDARLLASRPHESSSSPYRWLILADNGGVQPYVVSEYISGREDWISGTYHELLSEAAIDFETRLDPHYR